MPTMKLRDWENDWLYSLIFGDAEICWQNRKRELNLIDPEGKFGRYVLLEEYGASKDSMVCGEVLRAWTVDDDGLVEITLAEHTLHIQETKGPFYPFVLKQFHIHSNRKTVVLGQSEGPTCGRGCVYRVSHSGQVAQLVVDESFGFWIS